MKSLSDILLDIANERTRQDAKWGVQDWPLATESEASMCKDWEVIMKETCDSAAERGGLTWFKILLEEFYESFAETDVDKQIEEMTQVAAVAVAIIESLERKKHERINSESK